VQWDIAGDQPSEEALKLFSAAPGGIPTQTAFSQDRRWEPDTDRKNGCIHSAENAYSKDGGLAVLTGNIALEW